ncbi:LysM peptidoglycan-binding domain-containing protein [Parasalinivibrio latis]|uniref:LysM-like peptidoglycan-binding domain-containing protein n=1 Tax=Parasalinivibrio latis TaxID=2952610 RepID=UPI0030E2EE49
MERINPLIQKGRATWFRLKNNTADKLGGLLSAPVFERAKAQWQSLPRFHRIGVASLSAAILILLLLPSSPPVPETGSTTERVSVAMDTSPLSDEPANSTTGGKSSQAEWHNYEVQKGDTLANIFRRNDLPLHDLYAISAIEGSDKPLSRIQPGQLLRFKIAANGELDMLQIETGGTDAAMFFRLSDGSFGRQ